MGASDGRVKEGQLREKDVLSVTVGTATPPMELRAAAPTHLAWFLEGVAWRCHGGRRADSSTEVTGHRSEAFGVEVCASALRVR
jgi:hypothetical protein